MPSIGCKLQRPCKEEIGLSEAEELRRGGILPVVIKSRIHIGMPHLNDNPKKTILTSSFAGIDKMALIL